MKSFENKFGCDLGQGMVRRQQFGSFVQQLEFVNFPEYWMLVRNYCPSLNVSVAQLNHYPDFDTVTNAHNGLVRFQITLTV